MTVGESPAVVAKLRAGHYGGTYELYVTEVHSGRRTPKVCKIFPDNKPCQLWTKAQRFGDYQFFNHQGKIL
jgi:hypothetical protein